MPPTASKKRSNTMRSRVGKVPSAAYAAPRYSTSCRAAGSLRPTSSSSQRSAASKPPPARASRVPPSPACGGGLLQRSDEPPPPLAGGGWGGGGGVGRDGSSSRAATSSRSLETESDNSSVRPGASPSQNGTLGG